MTNLEIVNDKVVVKWTGRKGRGSLFQTMAGGNAENANKLSAKEILCVLMAVKVCPFPLGNGEKIYEKIFANIDKEFPDLVKKVEAMPLGQVRKELVVKCGSGCNAPHDMYLDIAVKHNSRS